MGGLSEVTYKFWNLLVISMFLYQAKQTMYHVYAVDLEKEPDWAHWQPRPTRGHEEEVDTSPTELIINGSPVRCTNGQCWVNLEQLCIQCCQKVNYTS